MIYAYTNTTQTLTSGTSVKFNTIGEKAGKTTCLNTGSGTINLRVPGLYLVNFNADVAASTTAGSIVLQLYKNGVLYPGAESTTYSSSIVDIRNASFTAVIKVGNCCNCCSNASNSTSFNIVVSGVTADLTNAAITVTKIA